MPATVLPIMASDIPLTAAGMQLTLGALTADAAAVVPGPDRTVTGRITVPAAALESAECVEIQYRGVEVVGGTLDDFEDHSFGGLVLKQGARALNRLYFDERLVLWQRNDTTVSNDSDTEALQLPFSIAYPNANYPSESRSECKQAPSQSFEIAYHIIVWLLGADNVPVARVVQSMPFVPTFSRKPSALRQAPVTQTGRDERGRECLFTRVTLSQTDYVPGDQIVAGVYIECTKSNRTIRKAECTLRQRVECRMRRTFSPAETAEIASSSRPQSSQPSAVSDDSDVLWSRLIDVGQVQTLTLNTSGVGLAAAAASGGTTSVSAVAAASTVSQGSDAFEASDKRDSSVSRTLSKSPNSIMSGLRACSANMHTSIPASASMISGHYLLFSYELQIDVTIGSLARGTQKISTHTSLCSNYAGGATTPTSSSGFTLSRQPQHHRALAEAHASSGSFSATAAHFPQNAMHTPASFGDDKTSGLRKSRFSVGAFQSGDRAIDDNDEDKASHRFSALRSAPIARNFSVNSAAEDTDDVLEPPNAVEQLRYRCEASLALAPKIFDPSKPAKPTVPAEVLEEAPGADSGVAGVTPTASISEGSPNISNAKVFIGTAQALQSDDTHGLEFDLAQAVYAAADKVMNDKEWERPGSCYLPAVKPKRKSKTRTVLSHTSDDAKPVDNLSRGSMESSRASSHFSDLDDVVHAISQLAPKSQIASEDVTEECVEVDESPGLKNIIQGIDFFETASDVGPELTGLLSADPNTLVFNVSLLDAVPESQSLNEAACEPTSPNVNMSPATDNAVLVQPGWTMFTPDPPHSTVLRRSISMPGKTEHMYSPQQAVARSAVEPSEYKTVLVRKSRLGRIDAGRLGMSPSSMSSASRMGLRSGVLRNLGQRFTSWFKK
ncbi:hypothetical protein GGH12_001216 [Coemansia sp. RSA 1822]|nr:hypothetical protein LPJ76_001089 [Coemansia sp. RSA 638]KAJ2565783.1 hypothetical protein GGH12_001216 [Coemansia sp. RSA 1822]